jgi:23S rRNA U2552 (ribose-2'-O)-methylase RlmE/FtsJ
MLSIATMNSYTIHELLPVILVDQINHNQRNVTYTNKTLRNYIHTIKREIDHCILDWEKNKRKLNPYEYINTPFDSFTPCVCLYKPISRAFFKLLELLNTYSFIFPKVMKSFHLAEGPGGFIEAIQYSRKNSKDTYYGMTLLDKKKDVPLWNKCERSIMKANHNIIIETGDGTGNLYHLENLLYVRKNHEHTMDLITADGGFDYSVDFNNQEESSLHLIFSEICFALMMQKKGGHFILKVFDTFSSSTIELIYLLTYLYEDVIISKPMTSRPANSEKYILCTNFKMVPNINEIKNRICEIYTQVQSNPYTSILNLELPNLFLNKIREINSIFGQSQVSTILSVLTYITDDKKGDKMDQLRKSHMNKCVKWCKKNNMVIHDKYNDVY